MIDFPGRLDSNEMLMEKAPDLFPYKYRTFSHLVEIQ